MRDLLTTDDGAVISGSRESRAGPCSAPSSPTSPDGDQQLTRHSNRGSKCNFPIFSLWLFNFFTNIFIYYSFVCMLPWRWFRRFNCVYFFILLFLRFSRGCFVTNWWKIEWIAGYLRLLSSYWDSVLLLLIYTDLQVSTCNISIFVHMF